MFDRIFPKLNHDCPQLSLEEIREVLGKLTVVGLLLFFTVFTAIGQSNLTLSLGEESVLLNQLVVCGTPDEQTVVFTIAGADINPRTNISATLNLFPGIEFANLNTATSTSGVMLTDATNANQPIFTLPDIAPTELTQVAIVFSVNTDCTILDTLSTTNLQIFDTWELTYQLNGESFSETFNGVEYKDVIATPNLNLVITELAGPFSRGMEVRRELTVSNSGLNSYLEAFEYQVRQEAGISYQSLLINGMSINFTKEVTSNNDTLINATIIGDFFIGNTKQQGVAGNNDLLFDVDEILTIEEVLILTSCGNDGDSNLGTTHEVNWGCNSRICQTETKSTNLPIGMGEALIGFTHNNEVTVDAGYCEGGNLGITVANNGFEFDEDFGAILNISTGVGFAVGAEFLSADQGYEINSITIGNSTPINAPNGLIELNNNPAFATDPDGEGGLEDVDEDGFFDDLRIGENFIITATYSISCAIGNQFDIDNGCDNDFRGNFDGKIEYTDGCGDRAESLFDNFYRSSNSGSTQEVCTDPDAFNDKDEFTVIYSGERRMSNFNRTCAGNDEIRISVTLPDGIALTNQTSIQQDTTRYFPTALNIDGASVMTFDATVLNLNNDYQVNFVFETQCAPVGPTSFPVEITYFCPECSCSHIWFCGILEGAILHAAGAPCAEFVCEVGLQTTDFSIERNTFGYTDANFATPFDPNLANKKVALSCDSVLMKMTNIVGDQSLTDSVGLAINYNNADESDSEATSFLFSFANVTIQSGGNTRTCVLDTTAFRLEILGSNKTMYFDLSSCLNGITLNAGDEINFEGHFAVNPDGPIPANTFKKIPALRGSGYAIIDGQVFDDCDSFGELFRLAKLNTTFSGPNNTTYPEGCATAALQYTVSKSINANAMRAFFGAEHRQAVKVDFIQLTYDPAILTAFDDLSVEYRIQGSQWLPLPNLMESNPGLYQTGFSFLNTASTIAGSNQVFQFRVNLTPSCSAQFGSSTSDDLYEIEAGINYQNRAYAIFDDEEVCTEINEVFDKRFFQYLNPPSFSLEAVVGDVQSGEETIQWTIEHCNTSFESDAEATFIQLEKNIGDAAILFIEDISVPNAIDTLALRTFNGDTSVFAFANRLAKRGTNVAPADICNTYRITAKMNSCGENSVLAKLGWNCVAYDAPNWTPDLYPPCEEETILLKASTLAPLLSASFQATESIISGALCDTSTMVILVRNEEVGNAFDIQSQIILPIGATLVPNSLEFSYPSTAVFQPILQAPNFLGNDSLGQTYQYDDFENLNPFLQTNGLPGFAINAPDSSEFKIKYRFITNCSYENGALNRYSFQGTTACGTPTNNAFAETNPIIFQADPSIARNFEIEFISDQVLTPNQSATFQVLVKNIGNNSSAVDKIEVELPEAFTYIANSIQATAPNNWMPTEPTIKNNAGVDVFNLLLPANLGQNESAVFQFEVNVGMLACDSIYRTKVATTSTIEFTCTVDGETCIYDFNSSNEGEFALNTSCELVACTLNVGVENSTILMPDCDSTIYYCFNQYTMGDLEGYTVVDNGEMVDATRFSICDYQQVCIYTYAQISNVSGDIRVDTWTVDGVTYSGTVSSITELVDSMNVWDEGGNWTILPDVLIIQGGHLGGDYSRMEITFPRSGIRSFLGYDTRLTPIGVSVFLTEGFHQLVVSNSIGCTDTLNVDVVRQECSVCTPPIVENIIVENTSCNQENGKATININRNIEAYNFIWSPNVGEVGATGNSRINLPAASYFVQIVDKVNNECFEIVLVNIGNSDAPNASFIKTDAICGMANGVVELSPDSFTYTWNDGIVGANRNDLLEGRYIVTVTDTTLLNCTNLVTIDISGTNPLTVTHTTINTPTCLNNSGIVTLDVSGGSGGYKTTFPNGSLTQLSLPSGAYEITVTDTITGCNLPYLFVLDNEVHQGAITITDTTNLICSGDRNGAINFDIAYEDGFVFPVDTLITDGQFMYNNGQLPAGNYEIHVIDGNGCLAGSRPFEISVPNPLSVSISRLGDCVIGQAINLNVQGGFLPYSFDWADVAGTQNEMDRTGLSETIYEVTITDGNDCSLPLSITLDTCICLPATIIDTTFIAADCGQSNGVVAIEITESLEDYTFIYEPNLGQEGATKNTRMALPAGDYEILIVYQGDTTCTTAINITIPENSIPQDLITATNILPADCGQSNGTVTLEITELIEDYTFIYEPNLGQEGTENNSRIDLPTGEYIITIAFQGDTTCAITTTVIVPENSIQQDLITATNILPADCGQPNGEVTLEITELMEDYTFIYEPNLGQEGAEKNSRTGLPTGEYIITIAFQGDTTCAITTTVIVPENSIPEDLITATNILPADCGQPNGEVTLEITELMEDYTFIYEPNLGQEGAEKNSRTGLPTGEYIITIAYQGDTTCAITTTVIVPENSIPEDLIAFTNILPADCGQANGVVSIELREPIDSYTFIYEPDLGQEGATKNTRMALPAGEYEVTVALKGNSNCAATTNITVTENRLTAELVTSTDIIPSDCGQSNGAITLSIAEDSTDYAYQWSGNAGQAGATPNSRTNLSAGTYDVIITATNSPNCTTVFPFTIPTGEIGESPLMDTLITNASCGQDNGQVTFVFADNAARYDYEWIPNLGIDGNVPNTRVNLPAGAYQINIIDPENSACSYPLNLTIPIATPTATATVFPSICESPPTGVVVLSPTNYTYTWQDGFIGSNRNELAPGTYEVSFTDTNAAEDCRGTITVVIETENILAAEAIIDQTPTCDQANGVVTLNVTGGSGDYSYSWASETNNSNDLAEGTYAITVFDATLGCQTTVDFELIAIPIGVATITITETIAVSCADGMDGSILFSVEVSDDFQLPMDTLITDGIDTFENGQLPVGEYCLEIKDAFGCLTGDACFTIDDSPTLLLMYEAIAACADTGGINLEITGGTAPYFVDWADLMGTDNPVNRTALDTGTYEVTVMDNNGCTEMASIFVPECEACNPPTITSIATTPSTCTGNTGSVFIRMEEDERDYDFIYTPDLGQPFVTGNIRASLPIGKYRILIVYKPNPACIMEVEVEVFEKNFDDLLPITSPSECGLATGRVLLLPASNTYTWADGFIGNMRSELPAGFYQVRVRDEEFDCETTLTVVVDEDNLLQSKVAINTPPTCGNADGTVTISMNGGSGDYSYSWEGGMPSRTNLRAGTYSVLVTDNRTGCKTPVVFTLVNTASELATIAIEEIIPSTCPLVADGEVIFTVNVNNLPTTALDTIISNGFTNFQNGQLPQGDYCLSIVDTMGCVYGQGCFTIEAPDFIAISTTIIPQCDDGGSITVNVDGGTPPYTFDWEDAQGFADQAVRTGLPAGFYTLTITDDNDCQTVVDTLWVTVCEPCPLVVGRDTIRYNIGDCSATQDICLDYDFDVRNPYIVTLNGAEIDLFDINSCGTDTIETYSPETLFGQGRIGVYTVTSWQVNDSVFSSGSFNSLEELVTQMNDWDPLGNWQFSAEGTLITGGASGSTYGQIDAMVDGTPITSFLSHETNIIKRGISTELSVGVHEMMIQDPITFCEDTLVIAITCTQTDTMQLVTIPHQIDTFCLSTMELAGALDTAILDCLNDNYVLATIEEEVCVIIEGINIGRDTLCIVLCDEFDVCDTTIIEIDVHYETIEDTIDVQSTSTFCLDTLGFSFTGDISSMAEICQDSFRNLANYEFDITNFCITYTGNTLGTEMTCIEICDDLGVCDTLEFFLSIKNNPPDLVVDTIFVGQTIFYCFDSIIFPEEITFFENECTNESGEKVDFFLDPITYCVEVRGVDIGREKACVVVCDADNNCDTAFFEIEVIEFLELPTANDDVDTTDKGVPVILNVKENDIPFGVGEDGLQILEEPIFGKAIANLDGSVTYFGDEYCEREDVFTYTLCNSNGCDTATVTIYLACVDIVIFTAVSPNRDDKNDVFYISGIEEFPQSKLMIYNRWGNIVYQVTNYQNDWAGTWKNNQQLPDGTYFYELELNEPNDNRMFRGFLELHR